MIVLLTCATVLAALGWLTAWMTADQVAGLVAERDAALIRAGDADILERKLDAALTNLREARAAGRVAAAASLRHAVAAEKAERRAQDAEFATFLALNELDRVDPRPNLGAVGSVALAVTS